MAGVNTPLTRAARVAGGHARRVSPGRGRGGRARRLHGAVALLALAGCGKIVRTPVPVELQDRAKVPGMPDGVRAWGDAFSPAFQQGVVDSVRQAKAAYGDRPPIDVLAISGGGSNGAYGAGLLCGWTEHGDRPTFRLVTGVSAGAILAPFAFLGPAYDQRLREMATTISDDKVFEFKGLLTAFTSDSLADTTPLAKFLGDFYDRRLMRAVAAEHAKGRRLLVLTTDLDAQRPVLWDLGAIATVDTPEALLLFRRAILASAAIPVLFEPVYIPVTVDGKKYDEMHVDGSTTAQVTLFGDAINVAQLAAANQLPATDRRPDLYVIRNAKLGPEPGKVDPKVADIAGRAVATLTKSEASGDLFRISEVAKRNGFAFHLASVPQGMKLPAVQGFDHDLIVSLFDRGRQQARGGYPWASEPPLSAEAVNNLPMVRTRPTATGPATRPDR